MKQLKKLKLTRLSQEDLAEKQIVREKYLSNSFVLRRKDFQLEK